MPNRKRYLERKQAGVCTDCGVDKATRGIRCAVCAIENAIDSQRNKRKLRTLVYSKYGGSVCICCGETEFDFLSLDHINGNGSSQRRELGGSEAVLRWIVKNNFPKGFQVLCSNCNSGRARNNGICPHKIQRA